MKNLTITLFFSAISFFSFAQTPFTEQTLLDMNKRMMQDFPKFMTEEVSPDYTFTTEDGAVIPYQTMKDFKGKILEWNTHDLKIKQIGNAAIVRGINKNSHQSATTGAIRKYNLQFIYTYEYKNGKWLWFSSHHIYNNPSKADEEAVIKKILDEHAQLMFDGDTEIFSKFWKDDPKNFHIQSGTAGEFRLTDNDYMKKNYPLNKPRNATPKRYNYNIKIVGNVALAHYDQKNISNDGKNRKEHNLHILEKVNGDWKIIGTSIHPNNLENEEKPDEIVKQWIAEYNKDNRAFFMDKCTEDFIASNSSIGGGKFFGKKALESRKPGTTSDAEITDMKSFQSGNLAVVMGIMTWHKKQADGSDKPEIQAATFVLQKKEGKWLYAGFHSSDLKQ